MCKCQCTDLPGNLGSSNSRHLPLLPGLVRDDAFINDDAVNDSAVEEDEEEGEKPRNMKAGRRKIKIEFIQDKSRRHITFSKGKQAL